MSSTSNGLSKLYSNDITSYPSELASQSKPETQSLIVGSVDSTGGKIIDSDGELRYEECISDDEPSDIPIMDIESTSVILRSLRLNVHTSPSHNWDHELIIDSGANASLVCEGRLLNKLVPLCSKVKGIDDTLLLDVKGQGSLRIKLENGTIIEIKGVLYVPDSKFNLVSVDSIAKSTHLEVLFGKDDCLLVDPHNPNFRQVLGYNHEGLYYLAGNCLFEDQNKATPTNSAKQPFAVLAANSMYRHEGQFKSGIDFENVTSKTKPNLRGAYTLFDAHCILGHPSFKVLDLMVKRGQLNPIRANRIHDQNQIENCPECVITKLVRSPHNGSSESNKASHPLERIHADLSGPYEIRGDKVYFMAIKDEFSGYIHVEFTKNKTQTSTLRVLDNFLKLMRSRVPQYEVRCIRTDNGTEFHNKLWDDYLFKYGITRDEIAPYSPQSNGYAESTNHQLKLRAKCLLLPTDTANSSILYDYAILHAAYLLNRTVNIRKGKTPFELLFHRMPTLKNLIRFGADVIVKPPQESIVKSRSNIEAVCGTFLGTATDSNCCRVWLKGDPKMRILLTTDARPLKSFNFLTHSLKVYCVAREDPRANTEERSISTSTTGSGCSIIGSIGSEQSRGVLPSVSTVKDIIAHNSSGNGAHNMKERAGVGGTEDASKPPIDHDHNLEEDSQLSGAETMPTEGDNKIKEEIEAKHTGGTSFDSSTTTFERTEPDMKSKTVEGLNGQSKTDTTSVSPIPETDHLGTTNDLPELDIVLKHEDAPPDPQMDSTILEVKPQGNSIATEVPPKVESKDSNEVKLSLENSTTHTQKSKRSNETTRRKTRQRKKSTKQDSKTKRELREKHRRKPVLTTIPDESLDIPMHDDVEMPFLLAPMEEREIQEVSDSFDQRFDYRTEPSRIHDIALPEASDTFPAGNDWMVMDEVAPLEPELTEAGEQPRAHVGDATMGHEEVLGPTDPGSLTGPEERNRSSGGVLRGDAGLSTANPHISDNSQLNSGSDVNYPPASDALSYQGLSRRDREAELETVAMRAAEEAIALLEERYRSVREQSGTSEERQIVPARARVMDVVPTRHSLQASSRRSTPHVGSKRVTGARRLRRRGVPEEYLPPSRGPKGLLPYHRSAASAEPEPRTLESAPQAGLLEYPEEGPMFDVVPLYELPGIDHTLNMALSRQFPEFEIGRIEELSDSGSGSYDQGEIPDHPFSDSMPDSESFIAGEQYDGNFNDSEISSHISVLPDDSEGNRTISIDPAVNQTIVGRSHEPNHPEPGTGNSSTPNEVVENAANQTGDNNTPPSIRNLRRPEARKVKKPLLAETRTKRGRVRKITWKMKEILRNAGYDPDAEPDNDDSEGPTAEPQFRVLLALSLMARRSQAMEYFTGPEGEGWQQAAQKELNSFKLKGVFEEIDPSKVPKGKTIIPMKWVLTKKFDADGKFKSYKARMVCQGFRQKPGTDYDPDNISSSVARLETLRVFIAIAASRNLEIRQADVSTAFLNADIKEDIIVRPAEGLELLTGVRSGMLWKLKKTVYGLKQSNKEWVDLVRKFMSRHGFQCNKYDENFYMKTVQGRYIYCLVYVDDILIASSKKIDCDRLLKAMNEDWEVKDLGPISRYLGMRFTQDSLHVYIDQAPYLSALLESLNMGECNPLSTPMVEVPLPKDEDDSPLLNVENQSVYRSLVGRLLWACLCTRPDLQFAVSKLSSKVAYPTESDMKLLKKCLRYIKGTLDYRLVFRKKTGVNVKLVGFSDASHGNEEKRTSQDGYIFLWNGTPISWSSRRQKSVSISTHQAEVYGISETIREAIWLRRLLKDFVSQVGTLPVYADNQAAISSAQNTGTHSASKHIDLRMKFNGEKVAKRVVKLLYVASENNVADVFTKPLGKIKFTKFRDIMLAKVPSRN